MLQWVLLGSNDASGHGANACRARVEVLMWNVSPRQQRLVPVGYQQLAQSWFRTPVMC
jgi:hypothetical protein